MSEIVECSKCYPYYFKKSILILKAFVGEFFFFLLVYFKNSNCSLGIQKTNFIDTTWVKRYHFLCISQGTSTIITDIHPLHIQSHFRLSLYSFIIHCPLTGFQPWALRSICCFPWTRGKRKLIFLLCL